MDDISTANMTQQIGTNLPFLRRYARALTGHQSTGDKYAAATLEAILNDPSLYAAEGHHKVALFRVFHAIWSSSGMPVETTGETGLAAKAQARMSGLSKNSREALLLHTIEEFTPVEVGAIMQVDTDEAQLLINLAVTEMQEATSGRVLIIEDEAVIAMDLESIVADMGHLVTGVARTEQGALDLAARDKPDLILSDIQLADNSSGIDAVNGILARDGDRPVVFITAFPERLLTGEAAEPAFLISKPFTEDQVRSAVSQAMFFASTETMQS